jgi:hypothetical protein
MSAPRPNPTAYMGVYYMCVGEATAMLLQERPPVMSFHFGLPIAETIKKLRRANITLLATATNPHEARSIEAAGVNVIVAQGVIYITPQCKIMQRHGCGGKWQDMSILKKFLYFLFLHPCAADSKKMSSLKHS